VDHRVLTDDERRAIISARLAAIEREHYDHDLNRRIGERIAASGIDGVEAEAQSMVQEALRAQALLDATHDVLLGELSSLSPPSPSSADSEAPDGRAA
jgi:hypothetical protein